MGLPARLLGSALLYAATAEPSAFDNSVLLQSRTGAVPGEDAVTLQVSNRSVGEMTVDQIFALPEGMKAFMARRRNATAKTKAEIDPVMKKHDEIYTDIDKLMDFDHNSEILDMTKNITHDFNMFYKMSLQHTQYLMQQFEWHRMDVAKVKHWMLDTFDDMKKFAYAAHLHMTGVVEDIVKATKEDVKETDEDIWSWDVADESEEWAAWLANVMQKIESPLVGTLAVWQGATTDLFNTTRVEFCQKALPALQCLVNISAVLKEDVAPLVQFINEQVEKEDRAEHMKKGLHPKLAVGSTMMTEMFFKSVESWVEYVNATVGGSIAVSFGCPLTSKPAIETPDFLKRAQQKP